ncbi:MAG: serine/threonine-protein kinase [Planctomycetota bacterium]
MFPPSFLKRLFGARRNGARHHGAHLDRAQRQGGENEPDSATPWSQSLGSHLNGSRLIECLSRSPDHKSTLVFLAESPERRRCVAKVRLPEACPESRRRHENEIQALHAISHPRIPKLLDHGTTNGNASYFVTEFVDAPTLLTIASSSANWIWQDRLATLHSLANLLSEVHASGFIHNDLSPENVLVHNQNEPHLLDFGITTEIEPTELPRAKITGSPAVISPEAIRREPTTTRSDIYSLGCLGFLLLNNQLPYPGKTPIEICWKHLNADAETPLEIEHSEDEILREALREAHTLVSKCMSKEASGRPQSAGAVTEALRKIRSRLRT